jgi:hypothetical protein
MRVCFVSAANKRVRALEQVSRKQNASKMLAPPRKSIMLSKNYYTRRVTFCQAKTEKKGVMSGIFVEQPEHYRRSSQRAKIGK